MPDFRQMAKDDPDAADRAREFGPEDRDGPAWNRDGPDWEPPEKGRKFDVKYAMSKRGKITTKSFKDAEAARNFLSKQQRDGAKGIISVAGNPVAKSGAGTKVVDVEPKLKKSRKSDFGSDSLDYKPPQHLSPASVQRARDAVRDLE